MTVWQRFVCLLRGSQMLPSGFTGQLDSDERVLATAGCPTGTVIATNQGLWWSENEAVTRAPWYLISKATWRNGVLTIVVAEQTGAADKAVLLVDRPARALSLDEPGKLPQIVHERVTSSIRSSNYRKLPGGGAWFVQRKVPGRTGTVLQVRPDPGTDSEIVTKMASRVAARLQPTSESLGNQ